MRRSWGVWPKPSAEQRSGVGGQAACSPAVGGRVYAVVGKERRFRKSLHGTAKAGEGRGSLKVSECGLFVGYRQQFGKSMRVQDAVMSSGGRRDPWVWCKAPTRASGKEGSPLSVGPATNGGTTLVSHSLRPMKVNLEHLRRFLRSLSPLYSEDGAPGGHLPEVLSRHQAGLQPRPTLSCAHGSVQRCAQLDPHQPGPAAGQGDL